MEQLQHLSIRITGKVQGVFFRDTARRKANELGIQGFARNEPDGSVYIEAEGTDEVLQTFLAWCQHGPAEAMVEHLEHSTSNPVYYQGFAIY